MNEKISIVIPCYKAERYIKDTINDVLAQTYDNWELICVSNGVGQEPQLAILNAFAAKMPDRMRVFTEEKGNVSNARNIGIKHATGEWITLVDGDDRIEKNHLQLLMSARGGMWSLADLSRFARKKD